MAVLSLTSNDLLLNADLILREQLNKKYGVDFEYGGFGDKLLQAARIALFNILHGVEGSVQELFGSKVSREKFFEMVDSEIREPGDRTLHFMPSLDRERGEKKGRLVDIIEAIDNPSDCEIEHSMNEGALSGLSYNDSLICRLMGPEAFWKIFQGFSKNESIDSVKKGVAKIKSVIESRVGGKYSALRRVYEDGVHKVYDGIMSGEIRNWQVFNCKGGGFFSWAPNVKKVIRYATTDYLIPYYDCALEDLPIQNGLKRVTAMHRFLHIGDNRKLSLRNFFLIGFPEFRDSPHWHPARWGVKGLSEKKRKEYRNYVVDYVFKNKLGCRTKGDVIRVLNEPFGFIEALSREKIVTPKKGDEPRSLYWLVENLDGGMYSIKPWELNHRVGDGTWVKSNGALNMRNIREYLKWVKDNFGLPKAHEMRLQKVPHFYGMYSSTKLSMNRLRTLAR